MYMTQRSQTVPSVPNCFNSEKTTLIQAPVIPGRLLQTIRDALPVIEDAINLHVPADASPLFAQLLSTWIFSSNVHPQKHMPSESRSRFVRWLSFLKKNKSVAPMKLSSSTRHTHQSMHNLEIISDQSHTTTSISSSLTTLSLSKSRESFRLADVSTPRAAVRNISGIWSKLGKKMRIVIPSRSNKRPRTLADENSEPSCETSKRDYEEEERATESFIEDDDTTPDQQIISEDLYHTSRTSMSESDAFFFNRYAADNSRPNSTGPSDAFNDTQRSGMTAVHQSDSKHWLEPNGRQGSQQAESPRLAYDHPATVVHPQIQKSKTDTNVQCEDPVPFVKMGLGRTNTIYQEPRVEEGIQLQSQQQLSTSSASLLQWQQQFHEQQQHHDKINATLRSVAWALYDIICKNHAFGHFQSDPTYAANPHYRISDPVSSRELYMSTPITNWRDIYDQICYVFDCGELTSEHGIITLLYIERMLESSSQHLCDMNWRLIVLAGLLTAVKVWDDCAVFNSDFAQIFPELDIQTINRVEQRFLQHIDWDVSVRCSLFANTYFELRDINTNMNLR